MTTGQQTVISMATPSKCLTSISFLIKITSSIHAAACRSRTIGLLGLSETVCCFFFADPRSSVRRTAVLYSRYRYMFVFFERRLAVVSRNGVVATSMHDEDRCDELLLMCDSRAVSQPLFLTIVSQITSPAQGRCRKESIPKTPLGVRSTDELYIRYSSGC